MMSMHMNWVRAVDMVLCSNILAMLIRIGSCFVTGVYDEITKYGPAYSVWVFFLLPKGGNYAYIGWFGAL